MSFRFRPFPGLTVFTLMAVAVLMTLGTWQYHRLQWKTGYLAGIEEAATSPPFTSVSGIEAALSNGDPIDFRRVELNGGFRSMDPPFFVFTAVNRDVSWRVFHVFDDGGLSVFAATDIVPEDNRDSLKIIAEDATLAGYVRAWRKPGWLAPQSSPHENRWFGFNPVPEEYDWADQVSGPVKTRYYIDAVSGADAADALPVKRPEIANNHLDYMLTWYGLALALLVIYGILHQREGRLTLTWK